jgi:hypothetical protein
MYVQQDLLEELRTIRSTAGLQQLGEDLDVFRRNLTVLELFQIF